MREWSGYSDTRCLCAYLLLCPDADVDVHEVDVSDDKSNGRLVS